MKLTLKGRSRRGYRVSRLATDIGISARTIKRRLKDHPELATPLCAKMIGGEWRFNYPPDGEYQSYLLRAKGALDRVCGGHLGRCQERDRELVQKWIQEHGYAYTDDDRAAFAEAVEKAPNADARRSTEQSLQWFDEQRKWLERRVREELRTDQASSRRLLERTSDDIKVYFGFGDEQREQDVARLILALNRKRARMGNDGEKDCHDTDYDRWEADAGEIPGTARRIAGLFNCPVRDAIKHWPEHLERMNEENRRRYDEQRARVNERSLPKDGEHGWREFLLPSRTWAHFQFSRGQNARTNLR